jgi:hypothetical protein
VLRGSVAYRARTVSGWRRRPTLESGMRFEGNIIQWGAAVLILLLILPNLYHSSATGSVRGGPQVSCDGNTGINMDSDDCLLWGEALLDGELQLPTGVGRNDVSRLEIERAFFGFIDRCTATISFVSPAPSSMEQVIPCR